MKANNYMSKEEEHQFWDEVKHKFEDFPKDLIEKGDFEKIHLPKGSKYYIRNAGIDCLCVALPYGEVSLQVATKSKEGLWEDRFALWQGENLLIDCRSAGELFALGDERAFIENADQVPSYDFPERFQDYLFKELLSKDSRGRSIKEKDLAQIIVMQMKAHAQKLENDGYRFIPKMKGYTFNESDQMFVIEYTYNGNPRVACASENQVFDNGKAFSHKMLKEKFSSIINERIAEQARLLRESLKTDLIPLYSEDRILELQNFFDVHPLFDENFELERKLPSELVNEAWLTADKVEDRVERVCAYNKALHEVQARQVIQEKLRKGISLGAANKEFGKEAVKKAMTPEFTKELRNQRAMAR